MPGSGLVVTAAGHRSREIHLATSPAGRAYARRFSVRIILLARAAAGDGSLVLRVALPVKDTPRFRQGRLSGGIRIFRLGRQLQHDRALAFAKMRQQQYLAVRKLQRIHDAYRGCPCSTAGTVQLGEAAAFSS
jgi:hypothetical protein